MTFDDSGRPVQVVKCQCQVVKEAKRNLANSGLMSVIDRLTFDAFTATTPWQKTVKDKAQAYARDVIKGGDPWFYIGGQVGCGKTHICTAIAGELLNANIAVKYIIWPEAVTKIKANAMDAEERDRLLYPLQTVSVLYVDDFLKTANKGNGPAVTDADIKVAFELFNARYYRNLPTIISCEWPINQLMDVDEGTISRIYQKSEGYRLGIDADKGKNYRMKGA